MWTRFNSLRQYVRKYIKVSELEFWHWMQHNDPWPERRLPEYCWRSWPPIHTENCGCMKQKAQMKLNALQTAKQIEKQGVHAAWATLWYHYTSWLPTKIQILHLKWKVKHPGKWVPVEDAQPHDKGDQTPG